jgi:hypothetical protein
MGYFLSIMVHAESEVNGPEIRLSGNPWQQGRSKKRRGNYPPITQHTHGQLLKRSLILGCLLTKLENSSLMEPEDYQIQ